MGGSMPLMTILMGMIISSCSFRLGEAQSFPPCDKNLTPCLDFVNSTHPPNTCCNPLRDLFETQFSCLCTLFFTPGLLEDLGINATQALRGSRLCGVHIDINLCKASASAPPPSSLPPPATLGADDGGAGRIAFTGLSFLLLSWAFWMFN